MGDVVSFEKAGKLPRRSLYQRSVLARTMFWLLIYVTGMFGVSFGMGFSLPFLIHQCAPVKPFMEKW